jgi:hypothetical protein
VIEAPTKPRKPLICHQFEKTKIHKVAKKLPQKKKRKKTLARNQGKL